MDALERLVSDTLTERSQLAPHGPVPLVERSRRTRTTIAVLAASVLMIAAAVIVAALHRSDPGRPSAQDTNPATPIVLPAGLRVASYGAASVRVAAGLPTRASLCGGPVANAVIALDGTASLCPVVTHRLASEPGTVVWFSSPGEGTPYATVPTVPVRIDGHPARRGYARSGPRLGAGVSGVVVLADQRITIGVTAPSRQAVDQVLSSIRIGQRDPLGCAATFKSAISTAHGPSSVLVPGHPSSTTRCQYSVVGPPVGLLVGSYLLDSPKTDQIISALSDLRPDPCHCVHGGTPAPGHDEILYFHYPDRSDLRINGEIGSNLDTYSNGTRTVANYSNSVAQLLARLTNQR